MSPHILATLVRRPEDRNQQKDRGSVERPVVLVRRYPEKKKYKKHCHPEPREQQKLAVGISEYSNRPAQIFAIPDDLHHSRHRQQNCQCKENPRQQLRLRVRQLRGKQKLCAPVQRMEQTVTEIKLESHGWIVEHHPALEFIEGKSAGSQPKHQAISAYDNRYRHSCIQKNPADPFSHRRVRSLQP